MPHRVVPTVRSCWVARATRPLAFVAIAVGFTAAATGCYTRVTRATGLGADRYNVSEPYQQDGKVDEWFWGKRDTGRGGTRLPPSPQRN